MRSGLVARTVQVTSATRKLQAAPRQKQPKRTSTRTPVACCPVASTQKTSICSPATEALLPAALITADTAATRITAGTDSAGVPPVSRPTR